MGMLYEIRYSVLFNTCIIKDHIVSMRQHQETDRKKCYVGGM